MTTPDPAALHAPESQTWEAYAVAMATPKTPQADLQLLLIVPPVPLDFPSIFGRSAPVHLEIGFGKGRFLVTSAEASPDLNFIGIEYAKKYFSWTLKRFMRRTCTNVRVAHAEANRFLQERVPDRSITAFHIYFNDPWPKKRHHKRRLFQRPFLDDLARCLVDHGTVHGATDFLPYGEEILLLFHSHPDFIVEVDRVRSDGEGFTNFEAKYLREGRQFRDWVARRKPRTEPTTLQEP